MNIDTAILKALRAAGDGAVSGAELSQHLGVSRAAVWARIEELRTLGYDIEASPHLGYRLVNSPDVLHADDLMSRIGKVKVIGRDIRVFEETTSTNDVIEKLARDGVKEGAVVFAESQSRGRGRLGRKWISPARKGLWFSILLRPDMRPQETTRLTVASATALRRAIESETGLHPEIKWPNDLLLGGKKVAGILTELAGELDHIRYVIVGIGVDVHEGDWLLAVDGEALSPSEDPFKAFVNKSANPVTLTVEPSAFLSCAPMVGSNQRAALTDALTTNILAVILVTSRKEAFPVVRRFAKGVC
jgi:BirA family biotin operon repressor/biotin-[acetyl-CoA-carboxylase] ligase